VTVRLGFESPWHGAVTPSQPEAPESDSSPESDAADAAAFIDCFQYSNLLDSVTGTATRCLSARARAFEAKSVCQWPILVTQ
jgi:hypothetical protein